MNIYLTIILIGIGLTSDAFAVAVTNGMCNRRIHKKHAFITAFTFALFQVLMPILGFTLGNTFFHVIYRLHNWVALLLLSSIGINMIMEAIKEDKNPDNLCCVKNIFTVKNLILQGIATSIDALAAGVSFVIMDFPIIQSSLIIGVITFIFSFVGVYIGRKFGTLLGIRARYFGGFMLIFIGIKIFIESFL